METKYKDLNDFLKNASKEELDKFHSEVGGFISPEENPKQLFTEKEKEEIVNTKP